MNPLRSHRHNSSKAGLFVLLLFSLLELLFAAFQITSGVDGGVDWPMKIFLATLLWFLLYLWGSYAYFGTVYLFTNAYLLALALFHLGLTYMLAVGQVQIPSWTNGPFSVWLELGGWYVVLALGAFGIGMAGGAFAKRPRIFSEEERARFAVRTNRFLFTQGIGLGIAAIIFLIMALQSYGNILAYSRAQIFALTGDSRGFGAFMMVLPSVVMLLALSAQNARQKIFAYPFAVFTVLLIMLSGYRSAALFPLLVAAILWVKSGRKIPVIVATSGVIFVLLAIAVIGVFRQMGSYESLGAEQLQSSYEQASIGDSIMEMGGSMGVLAEVLRLVPKNDPHVYGYSYWQSVKEIFPNIGLSYDASKSRGSKAGEATFDQSAISEMKPSDWLTYRLNRWKYEHGQGVGFSTVAEPFLNFGMGGVIVFFIIAGYVLTRLDLADIVCHPYLYLFMAAIFWSFIRTVRNDFSNFTKPMGFIIIILIIWNIGLYFTGKRTKF